MKKFLIFTITVIMLISFVPKSYADNIPFIDNPEAIADSSYSVVMLECYDNNELCATGSGFACFDNGIIVTNYHVIDGYIGSIRAVTEGGMYFSIDDVLCADKENDIALLKTNARTGMTILPVGSAYSMIKGSKVIAIGSPQGYINSVSSGLLSGVIKINNRDFIQFDANISHGSSGGALFNNSGEVIGITSNSDEAGNGLFFAVPIEKAEELWERYKRGETEEVENSPETVAEKLLMEGDYDSAREIYVSINNQEGMDACDYLKAIDYVEKERYKQAINLYEKLSERNYRDSVECLEAVRCLYIYNLIDSGQYAKYIIAKDVLKDLEESDYDEIEKLKETVYITLYNSAIKDYEEECYYDAKVVFKMLLKDIDYSKKDSSDLNILIAMCEIYGGINDHFDVVFNNLDYPDAKNAIVSTHASAKLYLKGDWMNEWGVHFKISDEGYLNDHLPCVNSGAEYYIIKDGTLYIYTENDPTERPDKEIQVIDKDHWKVYCYANNSTYTMTRFSAIY